jgi:hypothetical protein
VLLNRTGVGSTGAGGSSSGYANTGFAITLSSAGAANVHFYQANTPTYNGNGQLTGTWQPDGRGLDPLSAAAAFDAAGTATFNTFTGIDPNGNWTLYFEDAAAIHESTLNNFNVSVSAVPEPVNLALGCFACIGAGIGLLKWQQARRSRPGRRDA